MKKRFRIGCSKDNLALIREFVKNQLQLLKVQGPESEQFVLAVDEACANCMIHQHQCDGSSTIEVAVFLKRGTLYAEISDSGKAFPIDRYSPQRIDEIIRNRGKGGLGLKIIQTIMDEVRVEQRADSLYLPAG